VPGLLPISLGCLYIGYSYSALMRRGEDRALILTYVGLAVFFVTVAIPIQLKHGWVTISWAIEGIVLVWLGFKLGYKEIRRIGLGIGAMSLVKILLFDYSYYVYSYSTNTFLLNERMLAYLVVVLLTFAAAWIYKMNKDRISPEERAISTALVLLANFVLLVQLSVEAKTYFGHIAYIKAETLLSAFQTEYAKLFSARELSLSLLWVIYAFIMMAIGMARKFRALRIMALILFGAAILKIFLSDLSQLERAYRIISFITLGIVLITASFFYQRYRDEIRNLL
ncbi:MAG: DUF2339 domain-containing protein, partial [Candidatus Omnitrophica bacterium]|nr:DUF2339 domain-containing protein [Candidatus Omnitrophota bacterium]